MKPKVKALICIHEMIEDIFDFFSICYAGVCYIISILMKKTLVSLFIIFTLFITSCSAGAGNVTTYHNNEINNETLDSSLASKL